jgi:hypothetical protein
VIIESLNECRSVFRTDAWVQAWIDTWGNDSNIRLVDLGGRKNSLEYVYTEKNLIKKILPVRCLNLAGVGGGVISSPRSEYNDITDLVVLYEGIQALGQVFKALHWQQFTVPDVVQGVNVDGLSALSSSLGGYCRIEKSEPSYHVCSNNFKNYLQSLGSNTRLNYFNRRSKIYQLGVVEQHRYRSSEIFQFFKLLNGFHERRWGRSCYSQQSQAFMANFQQRIQQAGGEVIMESLLIDGEPVSVIFDIVWAGKRYNFQSGYLENKFHKVALGAIHLGYSIESAINNNLMFDFMAGGGKNSDYKKYIANQITMFDTICIRRSHVKYARKFYDFFKVK